MKGRYSREDTSPVRSTTSSNKKTTTPQEPTTNNNTTTNKNNNNNIMSDDGAPAFDSTTSKNGGTSKNIFQGGSLGGGRVIGAIRRRVGRNKSGDDDINEDEINNGGSSVHGNSNDRGETRLPDSTAFRSAIILTQAGADIGMAAAEAEAEGHGWDVTICICDPAGVPIQVKRNTSIGAASYDLAVNKAKSAALFGKATGTKTNSEADALTTEYPYLQIRGGVPLNLNGICCGAVGVSGMLEPEQDEQVAYAAVKAMADIYWSFQVMATASENGSSPTI